VERGISRKLARECRHYISSHFFPDSPFGRVVNGYRNENIEQQTFESETFDLVVSLDVTEHVFHPDMMFKEIYRTLRPGGFYISTFPIRKWLVEPTTARARLTTEGKIEHLIEPEYHGNPINGDGALVTYDYGYDIYQMIPHWTPFEVEISRFSNRRLGILGEYTEVIVCRKN
jgi:SAM-dependent methyltransferase